ncbi:MAG: GNAT family N-acetyltransferase [Gemmatimonadales bacterium]
MQLRPLTESDNELLTSLQRQDDVWEHVGTLPQPAEAKAHHLFAIVEGPVSLGFAGLLKSPALEGKDFELVCAMRTETQQRGMAKQACQLVLDWAFKTAKLQRVIACIDDSNEAARAIAGKLGMTEMGRQGASRAVFVKDRD